METDPSDPALPILAFIPDNCSTAEPLVQTGRIGSVRFDVALYSQFKGIH